MYNISQPHVNAKKMRFPLFHIFCILNSPDGLVIHFVFTLALGIRVYVYTPICVHEIRRYTLCVHESDSVCGFRLHTSAQCSQMDDEVRYCKPKLYVLSNLWEPYATRVVI
jgi:hypothetical protein